MNRLAHIPTDAKTAARRSNQKISGGMTRIREARFGGRRKVATGIHLNQAASLSNTSALFKRAIDELLAEAAKDS